MEEYRFVGVASKIGDKTLEALGQRISLTQEEAANAIKGGAKIVPAAEFEAIGFTAEELERYKYQGGRISAPESFWDKMRLAWSVCDDAAEGAEG